MKKQTFNLLFLAAILFESVLSGCGKKDPIPVMPTDGLVGNYSFDGNVKDESDFKNEFEIHGAPYFTNGHRGKSKSAIIFNGVQDYLKLPSMEALNFGSNQNYTICCWVKFSDQVNNLWDGNYLISKWNYEPSAPFVLTIDTENGKTPGTWHSGRRDGCNHTPALGSDQLRVDNGEWHHLAIVKDGSNLRSYVDGNKIQETLDTTNGNANCGTANNALVFIATQSPGAPGGWFKGAMDNLLFYNRALSKDEIKVLFESF